MHVIVEISVIYIAQDRAARNAVLIVIRSVSHVYLAYLTARVVLRRVRVLPRIRSRRLQS